MTEYPIYDVTDWERVSPETMGAKRKFWCRHPDGYLCLFKFGRAHAGEDWSEKIAAEIANKLAIPCAQIELATCQLDNGPRRGTISRDFTHDRSYGSLIHGNELFLEHDPDYPHHGPNFRVAQHTLDRILAVLSQDFIGLPSDFSGPQQITNAPELFAGYLMLDGFIINTDRHHQNWGILLHPPLEGRRVAELAPTFDHASSLGRELTDERRSNKIKAEAKRLDSKKPARRDQTIVGYLENDEGRSRIFLTEHDAKPPHPLQVFRAVYERRKVAAEAWLDQLSSIAVADLASIVDRVPHAIMSQPAREFALKVLEITRKALIDRTFQYV